ncbi:MAG: hypothetical protein IT376_02390 [Polyangiaceae bacterium]|nr:hypothetical protein [Polyangiaceae bacterium]
MLEPVALHQTRLRVPGVALDARGVALGARGLVLLASVERLVAFLAAYTERRTLQPLLASLALEVVRSRLGVRELTVSFEADSTERMDAVSDTARLVGGYTFTGGGRHFVQYRDADAPFGWDVEALAGSEGALVLHHRTFTQSYDVAERLELSSLLLRLAPHLAGGAPRREGPLWLLAQPGLGPRLASHLARAGVEATASVLELPAASSVDEPERRWLLHVPTLPARLHGLIDTLPGLEVFVPDAAGVAVARGYRHPVRLAACPVFGEDGLVLFRAGAPALRVQRLPAAAPVAALAHVTTEDSAAIEGAGATPPASLELALRWVPSTEPPGIPPALLVPSAELGLLRRLLYVLPGATLARARVAVLADALLLFADAELTQAPLGTPLRSLDARLYVAVGWEVLPRVPPAAILASIDAPPDHLVLLRPGAPPATVAPGALAPLADALLRDEPWTALETSTLEPLAEVQLPTLWLEPLGFRPLGRLREEP